MTGELALSGAAAPGWPSRSPDAVAEPFALELAGRPEDAAARWTRARLPVRGGVRSPTDATLERARELRLGAAPRRSPPRLRGGPAARAARATTRTNPAGLTAREVEVLALVAGGAHATPRSRSGSSSPAAAVDHHVSAILRKLDVRDARACRRGRRPSV